MEHASLFITRIPPTEISHLETEPLLSVNTTSTPVIPFTTRFPAATTHSYIQPPDGTANAGYRLGSGSVQHRMVGGTKFGDNLSWDNM
jgi:hypothetical protein